MATQQPAAVRTGERVRKRSAKGQQLDEEQALEPPPPPPKARRGTKDTSVDKSGAPPAPRRHTQEFQTATLPTNRTAQRGAAITKMATPVNLQAHAAGLPRPSSPPARIVGGQRQSDVTNTPSARLSATKAAEIARARSPFVSGRATSSAGLISTPATARRRYDTPSAVSRPATPSLGMMRPTTPSMLGSFSPATTYSTTASSSRTGPVPPSRMRLEATGPENQDKNLPTSTPQAILTSAHIIPIDPQLLAISHDTNSVSANTAQRPASQAAIDRTSASNANVTPHRHLSWLEGHERDWEDDPFYESEEFAHLCGPTSDEYHYDPETAREMASDPEADLEDDGDEQGTSSSFTPDEHGGSDRGSTPMHTTTRRRSRYDTPSLEEPDAQRPRLTALSGPNPCGRSVAQRVIAAVPGRKPRQMDFDSVAQEVIVRAISIFKLKVSAQYAYPDTLQEQVWAKQAWYQAVNELQVELMHESGVIQVIAQYAWNLRSELKTAAKSYIQGVFGFKSGSTSAVIAHNRDLAQALLDDSTFTYKTRGTPEEEPTGLYEADIIQMVINRVYYKSAKDDGVILRQSYTPFPLPALALVISAIQCAICEWSNGQYSSVTFREKEYKPIYDEHIKALKTYRDESIRDIEFDIVRHICSTIASEGCDTANTPPVHGPGKPAVSTGALSKAIAAYAYKKQTDFDRLSAAARGGSEHDELDSLAGPSCGHHGPGGGAARLGGSSRMVEGGGGHY